MDISITDISEVQKEILINVKADELTPHFEKAYKEYQSKAEIKGFRKGKAPLELVKKMFSESIEYSSLDNLAQELYIQAIKEKDIHPIGDPVLTDMDYKRGESLSFKIKYEIKPIVELKEYKGIALEKIVHKVTDDEIQAEIQRLRRANSTYSEANTVTDDNFLVTADFQELDHTGNPLIGKKIHDMPFYLAEDTLNQQIKEAMRGVSINDTRQVNIEIENEGNIQTNRYEFLVKKIDKVELPELNDELVKKASKDKVKTVDEYLKTLRTDLEKYWQDQSERNLINKLINEIVRRHDIAVPESLINGVTSSLIEEVKSRYPNKKLPPDFDEKILKKKNRDYATFQSKWFLIRERIIEKEELKVEDTDLEQLAEAESSKTGIDKNRLLNFYKNYDHFKDKILNEKLINFLKKESKITEIVTDKLPE